MPRLVNTVHGILRIRRIRIIRIALGLLLAVSASSVEGDDGWKRSGGETLSLDKAPHAVQERVAKESKGGEMTGFAKVIEDKKTVYIVDILMNGKTSKLTISEGGKLIKSEEVGKKDGVDGKAGKLGGGKR
ncbi:MAG: hypothetical protein H0V44_17450 [Planctomycetes bacterium]|nr:hypothetical protein [Planctomycetota bacterium]